MAEWRKREPKWAALAQAIEEFLSLEVDFSALPVRPATATATATSTGTEPADEDGNRGREREPGTGTWDVNGPVGRPELPHADKLQETAPATNQPEPSAQPNEADERDHQELSGVSEEDLKLLKDLVFEEDRNVSAPAPREPLSTSSGLTTEPQNPVETDFPRMIPCSCQGHNENCTHCHGKGYMENPLSARTVSIGAENTHPPPIVGVDFYVGCRICGTMVKQSQFGDHLSSEHEILARCPDCKKDVKEFSLVDMVKHFVSEAGMNCQTCKEEIAAGELRWRPHSPCDVANKTIICHVARISDGSFRPGSSKSKSSSQGSSKSQKEPLRDYCEHCKCGLKKSIGRYEKHLKVCPKYMKNRA